MKDLMKLFPALDFTLFFEDETYGYASGFEVHLKGNDESGMMIALPDKMYGTSYCVAETGELDPENYEHFRDFSDAVDAAAAHWGIKRS